MKYHHLSAILIILFIILPSFAQVKRTHSLRGYSKSASEIQRKWEKKFQAIPNPGNLRAYMKRLSARPHHLGSVYGKENAEWILAQFKDWGFDGKLEMYDVLFPTPEERLVEMVEPKRFRARLEEPAFEVDPTSNQHDEQLPTYNAYSADGDVVAPLVYVNYGVPEDYEELDRLGISVEGAIVIARYGISWRGIKPKVAAEHGAVGCLIFSDPKDDGYGRGDVFPDGAFRPPGGVQRGSVMDMPLYPGDPLTPGIGAKKGVKRLALSEAKTLTKIPVLPISYSEAQPLLAALGGPVAPHKWGGKLPITYHLGPGPAKVHLKVRANWEIKTLYNVVARISGSVYPDEWIIRGNHHDAWVNGASDPASGMASLLEEARAFGELLKQGWRPKRTIIYCAWDAEEQGLIGSTEWVEDNREELLRKGVAYINTDSTWHGFLMASGSHTLEKFINEVARDIVDPETQLSVWKRKQLQLIAKATSPKQREEARNRPDWRISALGSGSDYTAFVHHLGIASLDLRYSREGRGHDGVYHSIYDDFYWYTNFSDTNFTYGRTLAQTVGLAVLRLANAELLPFDFTNLADTVRLYARELSYLLKEKQEAVRERNFQVKEGVFSAIVDPRQPLTIPSVEEVPPHLNFAPLSNGVEAIAQAAERYRKVESKVEEYDKFSLAGNLFQSLNAKLIESERRLTSPEGLPGRDWFRHMIYAPGVYTGYSVKTIPGVREGIELKNWAEANRQLARVGQILVEEAKLIELAAEELKRVLASASPES